MEITRRIYIDAGFSMDGKASFGRCPGEDDCGDFKKASGRDRAEKAENACSACPKLDTKPRDKSDISELEDLIEEAEDIILDQDAGFNFEITEYYQYRLIKAWRTAEKRVKDMRAMELNAMFKGMFKK